MNDPMQRIKTENYRMGRYMVKYIADKGCVSRIYNILRYTSIFISKEKRTIQLESGQT